MLSKTVENALTDAYKDAQRRRHEHLCLEHLLFTLLATEEGQTIVVECGGKIERVRNSLESFFSNELEVVRWRSSVRPVRTESLERVLQNAQTHVRNAGKSVAEVGDIFAALLDEADSHAAYFLTMEGISRLDVLEFISHGVPRREEAGAEVGPEGGVLGRQGGAKDPLKEFTTNLTQMAKDSKLDPLIGRGAELKRIMQVLCRRRKNNPVLVGEPGVGKTAIVEGLAIRIVEGSVPLPLRDVEVYSLDMGGVLAGTRYRGDFEQRLKGIIKAVQEKKRAILFLDEIHTLVGAGSTMGSSMDASNILKPALSAGTLRCIGATTYEEYKNGFEKDRALTRRFQKIDIDQPSVSDAITILRGLQPHYEKFHYVRYSDEAVASAAILSDRHVNERYLPDKAIDVLDEAGAAWALQADDPPEGQEPEVKDIGKPEIERIVAEIARIPQRTVDERDKARLHELEANLRKRVFGQDEAMAVLAQAIKRQRAGLAKPNKPVGSFLFTGPTGVGKTEAAKQLAALLGVHFERFDMSEYGERIAVTRLIGAAPGYVGFDQGGQLTEAVRKNPYSVILLDELEKAHPEIFNILLQVMDNATLTDNSGRKADFRNVILIMTSNAGANEIAGRSVGFAGSVGGRGKAKKALERFFSPEFRNRLDATIVFNHLPREVMENIVDKFIVELEMNLGERKVSIELTPAARTWLAEHGYDHTYGARPLSRLIQDEVENKLTDELLFGKLEHGGRARVDVEEDAIVVACEPAANGNQNADQAFETEKNPSNLVEE